MKKGFDATVLLAAALLMIFAFPVGASAFPSSAGTTLNQAAQVSSPDGTVPVNVPDEAMDLLQFKAGNHVLGFQPNKIYFAALDHVLSVSFLGTKGATPKADIDASSVGRITEAPALGKVVYQDLWKGIDLAYESTRDGVTESTYYIAPGADISDIRLRYNVPVEIQTDGSLKFKFGSGYLTESSPIAWQQISGKRIPVTVAFKISGEEVGFSVGKYDDRYPLTIDPTYAWNTFYGEGTINYSYGMALDKSGNVYITGWSNASWNGPNNELPLNAYSSTNEVFILKLDKNGAYQWHTFYGSGSSGQSIAVDGAGNVYVTGYSSAPWNGPSGQAPRNAYGNIHVLKLNKDGAYQWHTFYGNIEGYGVTADSGGNVYVSGSAYFNWYGPDSQYPLNWHPGGSQAIVVLKLNGNGQYQWHTFYGANSQATTGEAIALDGSGNIYVTGFNDFSWSGPNGQGPLNPAPSNSQNIVVLKLDSTGTYKWHTFYGAANGASAGYSIAADANSNVYLTGYANGGWNGPADEAPLSNYSGYSDLFVLKLNDSGTYQWHTFFGPGNGGYGIAVGSNNHVYATGYSNTLWNGPSGQPPLNGTSGICILDLNSGGAYQWHAFYGSRSNIYNTDAGHGIAVDSIGNIFASGHGSATWGNPFHAFSGSQNIFVLKLAAQYLLTAKAVGTGTGSVRSNVGGIEYTYPAVNTSGVNLDSGTAVTLTATAGANTTVSWSGSCNSKGGTPFAATCSINSMNAAKTVTAAFKRTVVSVVSPNGNNVLASGSSAAIQWVATGSAVNFRINYSTDNGATWTPVTTGMVTGSSYQWTVPATINNQSRCRVQVIGYDANNIQVASDTSNRMFTIEVVKLTSPNGGETLTSGTPYAVTWTTNATARAVTATALWYSMDGGSTWKLARQIAGNPGVFQWTPPAVNGAQTQCRVKVVLKDSNVILASDISNGVFTINNAP